MLRAIIANHNTWGPTMFRELRPVASTEPSSPKIPMPDQVSGQALEPGMEKVVFLTMGFSLRVFMLFAGWRSIAF